MLKYIARLSSRATPFGLFGGCSTGILSQETSIQMDKVKSHQVFTQFDMHYWISLLQNMAKKPHVQKQLNYYPNTSLYKIADFYRYVEYQYVNKKREHTLSSFRVNSFIDVLLKAAKKGLKITELVSLIADNDSEIEEATNFVLELIDNQILVSELEATVTGNFDIQRIIKILENISDCTFESEILKEMALLLQSKTTLVNSRKEFDALRNLVQKLDTSYEEKYLIQTDLYKKSNHATLNKKVSFKIIKALQFLSKMQKDSENMNLTKFKNAFQKRYETREMPLSVVLDSELGIGYLQNSNIGDTHAILENFSFHTSEKGTSNNETWTKVDYVLEKKRKEAITNTQDVIVLTDKDFDAIENKNQNLPDTFSVMVEVFLENQEEKIAIESTGNLSAAKLIGRFCNGDDAIHKLAKEIVEREAELNQNIILAEIVHIPQDRTGNVLRRPCLCDYEIPYLGKSILPTENQITIEDLYISINNNKVVLKSKSHNKEILPCLSNAHNYSYNSLPIYHFLCDLQGQNVNPISGFNWGVLENHHNYFPRVVYAGVILSKAKWLVDYQELEKFTKSDTLFNEFPIWKQARKLPQYVNLVHGDNTLLLDLSLEIGMYLFLNTIKPNSKIILEEFLFDNNSVAKDSESNSFANQFILSFYKNSENE